MNSVRKAYKANWMKQDRVKNQAKYIIREWKRIPISGGLSLISNDYDSIYIRYRNSINCENCGHDYSYWFKCMDHCHTTGSFRNILCHKCNANRNQSNTSGYANISYSKLHKTWLYQQRYMKKSHSKTFKTKNEAIIYKWLYEAGYSIEV